VIDTAVSLHPAHAARANNAEESRR